MNLETWSFYTIHSFKQKKKCPHATEFKFKEKKEKKFTNIFVLSENE